MRILGGALALVLLVSVPAQAQTLSADKPVRVEITSSDAYTTGYRVQVDQQTVADQTVTGIQIGTVTSVDLPPFTKGDHTVVVIGYNEDGEAASGPQIVHVIGPVPLPPTFTITQAAAQLSEDGTVTLEAVARLGAAMSKTQEWDPASGTASNQFQYPVTGTVAGRTLVVWIGQSSSAIRTFDIEIDGSGEAFSVAAHMNPNRGAYVQYLHDAPGGDVTINVNASASLSLMIGAYEIEGLDPDATPIIPSEVSAGNNGFADSANVAAGGSHFCASPGEIDTAGPCFLVGCAGMSSLSGTLAPATGSIWTKAQSLASQSIYACWADTLSAVTDERCEFTHSSNARAATATMAAFPYASGGGTPSTGQPVMRRSAQVPGMSLGGSLITRGGGRIFGRAA